FLFLFFFFSSRRRHTRFSRDWSSDVCSSDLYGVPKFHDAREPCSFLISDGRQNIAVLTDIGRICDNIKKAIKIADVLLLESNFRSEEHTSELQSRENLVCRLLLEKKKIIYHS